MEGQSRKKLYSSHPSVSTSLFPPSAGESGEMDAASGINCTPLLKISKFAVSACWCAIWPPTRWTLWLMLPSLHPSPTLNIWFWLEKIPQILPHLRSLHTFSPRCFSAVTMLLLLCCRFLWRQFDQLSICAAQIVQHSSSHPMCEASYICVSSQGFSTIHHIFVCFLLSYVKNLVLE